MHGDLSIIHKVSAIPEIGEITVFGRFISRSLITPLECLRNPSILICFQNIEKPSLIRASQPYMISNSVLSRRISGQRKIFLLEVNIISHCPFHLPESVVLNRKLLHRTATKRQRIIEYHLVHGKNRHIQYET